MTSIDPTSALDSPPSPSLPPHTPLASIPLTVLLITYRESLEAALTLALVLQCLSATLRASNAPAASGRKHPVRVAIRQVWAAAGLGVLVAATVVVCLSALVRWVGSEAGLAEIVGSEGVSVAVGAVAVALQTYVAVKLLSMSSSKFSTRRMAAKLSRRLSPHVSAIHTQSSSSTPLFTPFALLVFTAMTRELLEISVYISPLAASHPSPSSLLPFLFLGLFLSALTGLLVHRFAGHLDLGRLIRWAGWAMLVVGAGTVAGVVGELEEALSEGEHSPSPVIWDIRSCCDEEKVWGFGVLNAIVGFRARATVLVAFAYIGYWVLALLALAWARKRKATKRSSKSRATRSGDQSGSDSSSDSGSDAAGSSRCDEDEGGNDEEAGLVARRQRRGTRRRGKSETRRDLSEGLSLVHTDVRLQEEDGTVAFLRDERTAANSAEETSKFSVESPLENMEEGEVEDNIDKTE
ncbi:hypothetical protein HDU96_000136 [Phlyctochytrium bullatum]|nr:hypothetical protein HDU96_000136 [Phlyctochytrium bullatum]